MMKFTIGPALPVPRNEYLLHVCSMSGDADSYQTEHVAFDPEDLEGLTDHIQIFAHILSRVGSNDLRDHETLREEIREVSSSLSTLSFEEAYDMYSELVGSDLTYRDGTWARIDSVWVTYRDPEGVEFEVQIELELNGKMTQVDRLTTNLAQ